MKLATTPIMAPIKTNCTDKKTIYFIAKPTAKPTTGMSTNTKTVVSVRKSNPIVVNIEVDHDNECIVVIADDNELLYLRMKSETFSKTPPQKKQMMNDSSPICKHCRPNQPFLKHLPMPCRFKLMIEIQMFELK